MNDGAIYNEEDDDATQPVSSPGHSSASHNKRHDSEDEMASGSINETLAVTESAKEDNATVIDISYQKNRVTWNDASEQLCQMEDVSFDLYLNTSTNTAMFKLQAYVILRGGKGKSNKQAVYLYIHPERIQAITYSVYHNSKPSTSKTFQPRHYSLCISMTQTPDLIRPRGRPLDSKGKTKTRLHLFEDLASVTKFIVHLDSSNAVLSKADFDLLEKTFSSDRPEGRPRTDLPRANPATLYAGHGGEVAEKNEIMRTAESPPPYAGSAQDPQNSKKRRRADYSDEESSGVARVLILLKDVVCRLDNIENRIETRFDDMESRVSGLEQYIKDNLREALDGGRSPCRYGTEEREEIFEEMNNQLDDCATELKCTCEEAITEMEKESGRIMTQVTEDMKEEVRLSNDDTLDNLDRTIDDKIRATFKTAKIKFDGTFGLEF
ncbi:hypothetical protein ACQKWADRAFT_298377 [Trichoderma austrokoningii]